MTTNTALPLTGMMNDDEITREQELNSARMVLHDNPAKLYGLKCDRALLVEIVL